MKLATAIAIAGVSHENHTDKAGGPYIFHPIRVCMHPILQSEDERVVGALHDTVEDDDTLELEDLIKAGLTPVQSTALDNVTRRDGETWSAYVERVVTHVISIKVKIADLEDNMDVKRLNSMMGKDAKRLTKYHSLWIYLRGILEEMEG